jgi:hypothetical protein
MVERIPNADRTLITNRTAVAIHPMIKKANVAFASL